MLKIGYLCIVVQLKLGRVDRVHSLGGQTNHVNTEALGFLEEFNGQDRTRSCVKASHTVILDFGCGQHIQLGTGWASVHLTP